MKLYDWHPAPNPRRVRMFLAEKGIEVPLVEVGGVGLALRRDYLEAYPGRLVPMLELDDGTQIGEALAICRYFEELHPDPALLGAGPREKAVVEMWERRAYEEGLLAASEMFRNTHPEFVDRGLPGSPEPVAQIPALAARGRGRLARFYQTFDDRLREVQYLAGDRFSVADITTLCTVDFATTWDAPIPESCAALRRWHAEVSARPSAAA